MNRIGFILALALMALVAYAPMASASTTCALPTSGVCKGFATVSTTTGGVASTRCFTVRTVNTAPTCEIVSVNDAWQMDSGACVTLRYFDTTTGTVPPAVPNKVSLDIRFDSTATIIKTFLTNAAEPANGATFSFCATDTGNAGGANRAGTYRILLTAIKDNGAGGVGNYNVNSDGTAAVGAISHSDKGALQGLMCVATVSPSAYPADSIFAYGTAADEQVILTSTITQPNGDADREKLQNLVLTSPGLAFQLGSASIDIDAVTTYATPFTVDNTFITASQAYVGAVQTTSTALLTGIQWTEFSATCKGATITIDASSDTSNIAHSSTTFNVDPRIKMDSVGTHSYAAADGTVIAKVGSSGGTIAALYNKGEAVYYEWYGLNSRGEQVTRAMTYVREDASNTVCQNIGSLTPTSGKYSTTSTLNTGATCTTAADLTGSTRHLRVTNTNQVYVSGNIFYVSSLLRFDTDGTGAVDGLVHECATSCPGADIAVFNRGETMDYEGYLINARGTQYSNAAVVWTAKASDATTTNTQTPALSAGKYSGAAFTLSSSEKATADTVGDPHTFTATADGNTATTDTDFGVSSQYFLHAHIQLSASMAFESTFPGAETDDTAYIISNAVTDTTHGGCWVVGVRKDVNIDTSGAALTWRYVDPVGATRLTGTTDTDATGKTPTHLDYLAGTPLGTWSFDCILASFNGNTGSDSAAFTVSVPAGGGGFPGDPFRASCTPVLVYAGDTVLCVVAASNIDGSARTGAAASILFDLYNPSGTLLVTAGSVVEQGSTGVYSATYSIGGSPALGNDKAIFRSTDASPVTAHALFTVRLDPTIAIATNVAAIITNQGTAATQVSGVQTTVNEIDVDADEILAGQTSAAAQVSGVATQVSGVQTTVNEIDGDADEILAGQTSAATQVSGVATQVSGVQTSINTVISSQASNLATLLAESEESEHAQDLLINYTTMQILDALQNLNVTITGNFSFDNATLNNITSYLTQKFGPAGEPVILDLSQPLSMTALLLALLIIAEWKQDAIWFLLTAIVGGAVIAITPDSVRATWAGVLVPVIIYALVRIYFTMGHFQFREDDDEIGDD